LDKINDKHYLIDLTKGHNYKGCKRSLPSEVKHPLESSIIHRKILPSMKTFEGIEENDDDWTVADFVRNSDISLKAVQTLYSLPNNLQSSPRQHLVMPIALDGIFSKYILPKVDGKHLFDMRDLGYRRK
jgi:hypothetical protein